VVHSVRYYKARCVTRYDAVVEQSTSPDVLLLAFVNGHEAALADLTDQMHALMPMMLRPMGPA
jgi:hypothetical protein